MYLLLRYLNISKKSFLNKGSPPVNTIPPGSISTILSIIPVHSCVLMTFGTTNFHLKEKFVELNKKLNTKPIVRIFMPKGRGEKSVKKFNSHIQEDIDAVLSEKEIDKEFFSCFHIVLKMQLHP